MTTRTTVTLLAPAIIAVLIGASACQHPGFSAQAGEDSTTSTTDPTTTMNDDIPRFQDATDASDKAQAALDNQDVKPAVVFGASIGRDQLTVQVLSNGCTQVDDFDLQYSERSNDQIAVTVLRSRPDHCRKMPAVIEINLPLDPAQVADKAVILVNDIAEMPVLKRG